MKKIYHGTNKNFNELKASEIENTHEYYGDAIYFSDSIEVAKFYGKKIWVLNIDDKKLKTIRIKKGLGIKSVGDKVKKLIKLKENIKIPNIYDANLDGAQVISITFQEFKEGKINEKYPFLDKFFLKNAHFKIKNKKEIEAAKKAEIEIEGFYLMKYKNEFSYGYKKQVTKIIANKLNKLGIPISVQFAKVPKTQTTYIITDDKLLKKAVLI